MAAKLGKQEVHKAAWGIGCVYLILAIAYGLIAPPFESPDEIGHFFTTKYIADFGRLPVPDVESAEKYLYSQEGTQPPLYYLVGALIVRASDVSTERAAEYLQVNPHTTCGSPQLAGNKGFLAHDPLEETFPWQRTILALHLLRLYSTFLGLATVLGVYAIVHLCFPEHPGAAAMAAALTALNPQFLFVSAGINNDNMVVPLCTWALYWLLRSHLYGFSPGRSILAGVCIGLAAISKLGGVLLVPLAGLMLVSRARIENRGGDWRLAAGQVARAIVLMATPVLILGGWWYLRNTILYDDPTLTAHHLAIVSLRDPTPLSLIFREVPSMFHSYWGRFTCDITPGGWYAAFWGLITLAGLGGLIAVWKNLDINQKSVIVFLATWFVFVFAGWFRWNLSASGVQGRLLFPATASVSALVAVGLARWVGQRTWPCLVLFISWSGLALWAIFGFIRPTFTPPPRYQDTEELTIQHPTVGVFGDRIVLVGYDLPDRSIEPGEDLEVTVYLQAIEPLTDTYSIGLWLVSAVPGDISRLAGLDTWPGNGNYPTTVWQAGEIIKDTYTITAPDDISHTQAWMVQLNIYRMSDGKWLEYTVDDQSLGQRVILGWIRAGSSVPLAVPAPAQIESPVVFGESIGLLGARVETDDQSAQVPVILWWEARDELDRDLTVFVHVVDAAGQIVANGDGPPLQGGFPTSLWQAGDGVVDEHVVALPKDLPAGEYTIQVGWYDPASGARLSTGAADSLILPKKISVE